MEKEVAFLALTIAIELPVAMFVLRKIDWRRLAWIVVCVNMVTHPIAWNLYSNHVPILPIEIGVALIESLVLGMLFSAHRSRAFLAGIAMNTISTLIGIAFF